MQTDRAMDYRNILFETRSGVAFVTLNRPESLNSFTADMHAEMRDAMQQVAADKTIRCLLLTGAGRGFCAGQDLNDRAVAPGGKMPNLGESIEQNYNPLVRAIIHLEKPVVCAVNGIAAGAGANIALACDIVLAGRSAGFIQGFSRIGLVPDSGHLDPAASGRKSASHGSGHAQQPDFSGTGGTVGYDLAGGG